MSAPQAPSVSMTRLALGGVLAVVVLNLLLRTWVKLGGLVTTVLIATLVAAGMALWFTWRNQRRPRQGERRRLLALYGGILALLYLGLLAMMALQDDPSPMGLLIFGLHYFCYPLLAWGVFARGFTRANSDADT
jgi:drug/metabolite transporter (DMT)-like permease